MAALIALILLLFISIDLSHTCSVDGDGVGDGVQLILVNNCNHSIWPAILGGGGFPTPQDGGFHLSTGEERFFTLPKFWSGRIWPRQGCHFNEDGRSGSCETGDCNGRVRCKGLGGKPPATVVEMTFGTPKSAIHYYDVSLVDGFNLPVSISPVGGGPVGCGKAGCEVDLNVCCPSKLQVRYGGKIVGCKSACLALKSDKYCCTGEVYGSPGKCKQTAFSHLFKSICPHAYSFAYDDPTSLMSCGNKASHYHISFCPQSK